MLPCLLRISSLFPSYIKLTWPAILRTFYVSPLTRNGLTVGIYATRFSIQKFYILPLQFIYVFCMDLRTNPVCN